jgi:hypothetical protein
VSLADFALRIATVRSLRGRTYVGENVLDEPIDPVAQVIGDAEQDVAPKALIAVYTNASESKPQGKDIYGAPSFVEVTLQIYVPYETGLGGTAEAGQIKGAKFLSDMIERQIERVFLVDTTPWAKVRRDLTFLIHEIKAQSFVIKTDLKLEVSGRELTYRFETISSQPFGKPLIHPYPELLGLMRADTSLAGLAEIFNTEATSPTVMTDVQTVMAGLGISEESVKALGLGGGASLPSDEDPEPATQITIVNGDVGGSGDGGIVVVDDGSIVTEP